MGITDSDLRHTPGSTTPKTGPVPPNGPEGQAGLGNIAETDERFGKAANRSTTRIVRHQDRMEERDTRLGIVR
jgi:hypothetical protein